jgi:glycosyltransferase involved in cell wall biosynthesis
MSNVLFLTNKLLIGGAEMVFVNQVNLIDKNKFNTFVGFLYSTNKKNNLYHKLKIGDDKITHFNLKQKLGALDIGGIIRITKFLRKNKIDVIFTSLFEANFTGRLAAKLAGTKVIISSEHSCYYDKKYWQKKSDWFLSFFTDKIVAVTEEVIQFTSKQEKISKKKFKLIKQISDLNIKGLFDRNELRQKFEIPKNALVCGTLGRFSLEKAQYRIIDIANHVVNNLSLENIYFVIIGYGNLYDELIEKVKKYNLEKYVKIIVDPDKAKEYLVMTDVFLLTSDREGMPIVLLEAMNNNLPCIAFGVGGVSDIVVDEENGFLVPANNIDIFIEKILWFDKTHNQDSTKQMRINARNQAVNMAGDIKELEDLFISLINKK